MSKFLRFSVPAVVILMVGTWFLVKNHRIAGELGWPQNIHRSSNALGMLKVYDAESGTTIFWYHSDPDAHPIRIERQDDNHWIVVFEKAKK